MNASAQPETRRWPPQIKFIVGNEACVMVDFGAGVGHYAQPK